MKSSTKLTGYLLAAVAAASYGTNPGFAIPLYEAGMNPTSVLLMRYLLSLPLLAVMIKVRGIGFGISRHDTGPVAILGIMMALSSLGLFASYEYINSGIASTLLFVYPIMVAVLMIFFFHERFRLSLMLCLLLMGGGLLLLMKPGDGASISMYGVCLVMLSSLTYALYIVMVNVSKTIRQIPTTRLLFHVIAWGSLVFVVGLLTGTEFTPPRTVMHWVDAGCLAAFPTVLSLWCTTRAIQIIGSTPTAILGALEPVTAVFISVLFLNQSITGRDVVGTVLILGAATGVVAANSIDTALLHIRKMFPRRRRMS